MLKRFQKAVNRLSWQSRLNRKREVANAGLFETGNVLFIAKKRKARAWSGGVAHVMAALCLGVATVAHSESVTLQDAADLRMQAAQQALEEIRADNIELQRLIDYQKALIELAQNDRASARAARKPQQNCAERPLVRELCQVLTTSFPPLATIEQGGAK